MIGPMRANYTVEMHQDLIALHSIDVETAILYPSDEHIQMKVEIKYYE